VHGAWQDRAERWKGTLEPGRVADLAVLDGPIAGAPPESYPKLEVTLTVVGGRIAYRRRA
jgi:predicted amidohydrolase YtcJ